MKKRCPWCGDDPLYIEYHDREWGRPVRNDRKHFEMLVLEGAQAGLNWLTILKKREGFRRAFASFEPVRVACFTKRDIRRLMADARIVRNRLKIESAISNARAFLNVQREFGSFNAYVWGFVGGAPKVTRPRTLRSVPSRTKESEALSGDLRRRGFRFVGPTITYAYMQAAGLVDDHLTSCFRKTGRRG